MVYLSLNLIWFQLQLKLELLWDAGECVDRHWLEFLEQCFQMVFKGWEKSEFVAVRKVVMCLWYIGHGIKYFSGSDRL